MKSAITESQIDLIFNEFGVCAQYHTLSQDTIKKLCERAAEIALTHARCVHEPRNGRCIHCDARFADGYIAL